MIAYFLALSPAGAKAGPKAAGDGGKIAQKAIELQVSRFIDGGLVGRLRRGGSDLAGASGRGRRPLVGDQQQVRRIPE
jgi:hypothetical protein